MTGNPSSPRLAAGAGRRGQQKHCQRQKAEKDGHLGQTKHLALLLHNLGLPLAKHSLAHWKFTSLAHRILTFALSEGRKVQGDSTTRLDNLMGGVGGRVATGNTTTRR